MTSWWRWNALGSAAQIPLSVGCYFNIVYSTQYRSILSTSKSNLTAHSIPDSRTAGGGDRCRSTNRVRRFRLEARHLCRDPALRGREDYHANIDLRRSQPEPEDVLAHDSLIRDF